jgi:sn-glycerol 3-phosphate transport system ATP-binding protein
MVFQSYALFPHLNVKENIQFGLKVRKVPAEEREKKVAEAAQVVGLTELLDRKPANLSGGQRQRVALARSIVSDQSVCLMDEPLSNLDSKLRAEMRDEIRDLQKRLGLTVVYVTHDQVEAMSMADQIILLKLGEIVQVGAPEEIYNSPNSVFSAQFIGLPPMNILNLNEIDVSSLDSKIYSAVDSNKNIKDIGIRPEHIVFSKKGLPVVVKSIDYFGGETVFKLTHQEKDFFLREPRQPKIQLGDKLNVSWNLDDMYLFDKNDQRLKS